MSANGPWLLRAQQHGMKASLQDPAHCAALCQHFGVLLGVGVVAELLDRSTDSRLSIELILRPFADLEDGSRIVAHLNDEPPRLLLGLANVDRERWLTFVRSHLYEAYMDPVSGDPMAWQALIASLGDEGLDCVVATLRALPFAVEFGPRLTAALG
jgi:hypothetical protein